MRQADRAAGRSQLAHHLQAAAGGQRQIGTRFQQNLGTLGNAQGATLRAGAIATGLQTQADRPAQGRVLLQQTAQIGQPAAAEPAAQGLTALARLQLRAQHGAFCQLQRQHAVHIKALKAALREELGTQIQAAAGLVERRAIAADLHRGGTQLEAAALFHTGAKQAAAQVKSLRLTRDQAAAQVQAAGVAGLHAAIAAHRRATRNIQDRALAQEQASARVQRDAAALNRALHADTIELLVQQAASHIQLDASRHANSAGRAAALGVLHRLGRQAAAGADDVGAQADAIRTA